MHNFQHLGRKRRRLLVLIGACIFAVASLTASSQTKADGHMTKASSQGASLDDAFTRAVTGIDEERRTNRASQFGCTERFSDFRQHQKIEPYVEFFQRTGLRPIRVNQNQKHFITFEFTRDELSSRGYHNFRRGDRLVLVFTTSSAESSEITSFSATVFGPRYP
jgi:hypothetical protein